MALAGRIRREIAGVLMALAALYIGMSLFTYERWDPSFLTYTSEEAGNYGGALGASVADLLFSSLGYLAFSVPVFMLVFGVMRVMGLQARRLYIAGMTIFIPAGCVLLYLSGPTFHMGSGGGGLLGSLAGGPLVSAFSLAGAYLVALCGVLASVMMFIPLSLITAAGGIFRRGATVPQQAGVDEPYVAGALDQPQDRSQLPGSDSAPASGPSGLSGFFRTLGVKEPDAEVPPFDTGADALLITPGASGGDVDARGETPVPPSAPASGFRLPPMDMLREYSHEKQRSAGELRGEASLLKTKLGEFNVKGQVVHVHEGPVVSLFEFEPAAGVKMNKVISLSDDLALGLKAQSVRISAVPGKATIGIEVPNRDREIVSLKEIIGSDKFANSASRLSIAMGKDIFGKPVVADLARMPHLLVAGATGSGKSVFVNSLIMSILYKAGPDEVKMLMIDPKLLELSSYDGIPHLLAPVVTSPKDASEMLRRMVFEMERRYRVLADKGVRNIDGFNAVARADERLPYIVVIIDELADLMLASSAQVEDSIARLAQMARAAGIHLLLATQRPSVDVITGVIKANFPARVAFQVTSGTDSRTIIGSQGAEHLIGRGDMLFMVPGVKMMRVHGALVTESEVNDAVKFVKAQGAPDYSIIESITQAEEEAKAESEHSEDRDDLFWRAVEFAEATGEVSISSIQRKLKIGYNRAARIMEIMEEDGMVGPPKGAGKPRDFMGRGRL